MVQPLLYLMWFTKGRFWYAYDRDTSNAVVKTWKTQSVGTRKMQAQQLKKENYITQWWYFIMYNHSGYEATTSDAHVYRDICILNTKL